MENYKLVESVDLGHIGAVGRLYSHASGARVMHLESKDTNKVFSVAFATPPEDDSGIAHIMEHVVLGGSRKYPLKDPFMQLANGSLYTFLNAYTYPDKTVYPVASTNDADFLNLVDVYCDAVFFPLIYERKHGLLQEGWHYQLASADDELKLNGVVYNEMKGAFSDPYRTLYSVSDRALHPDSIYRFEAGGDPAAIPMIDNEYFINFHKNYYCPENALIYFYGDMDIELCLKRLHEEYLSKFERRGVDVAILPQPPLSEPAFANGEYSVSEEEDLGENYMSAAYLLPEDIPALDVSAMKVLNYILMGTPASPLYKALVEAEVGEDVAGSFSADALHSSWGITMCNGRLSTHELKEFCEGTLERIVNEGLSADFVNACLNFLEFQAKEEDYGSSTPKGLVYNLRALAGWLYGKSPWEPLSGILHLTQIRKNCEAGGYFEGLIQKYVLDNKHCAYVVIDAVLGLDEKVEAGEREKLAGIKANMTDAEIDAIIGTCRELKEFQETPDTPEQLALIPRLRVSDIKKEIERVPLEPKDVQGARILHAALETNDIIYSTMIFGMDAVNKEQLPLTSILQYMLSKVATKNYDLAALTQEIKGNLGGLGFSSDVITKMDGSFEPVALVSTKFLSKNTDKMFAIVKEITQATLFNDKSQMKSYLLEMKASMDDKFLTGGSAVALSRTFTYFSPAAAYQDATGGLGFYAFLKELCENFDSRFDGLSKDLIKLAKIIYNKSNARFSIVCNEELYGRFAAELGSFYDALDSGELQDAKRPKLIDTGNEGIATASKVQYCAQAANYFADGYEYSGALKVLGNVLDNYLYEEIRAKGGAYGCGCGFNHKGNMYYFSYRDPGLESTFDVFKAISGYVRTLEMSDMEIEKYILGAIRAFDRPVTNAHKGLNAASNYMQGWTDEARQKERDELLGADLGILRGFSDMLEAAAAQNHICAVGNAAALEGAGLFDEVRRV
ncbi:MAG: insulinase family protein [Defluviitaleaceae bacterium]|nr:insulinase family protein [Defluviitaleaceae bacterium]